MTYVLKSTLVLILKALFSGYDWFTVFIDADARSMGSYSPQERYTINDVADVVEYARQRGVRIMIEIDNPGHAASWCKGHPEVPCAPFLAFFSFIIIVLSLFISPVSLHHPRLMFRSARRLAAPSR